MPDASTYVNISLEEVAENNKSARHIVAGFSATMPILTDIWRQLKLSLDDVPLLISEVVRLSGELHVCRLNGANLVAAGQATVAAYRDGERDFLFYLRDELAEQNSPSSGRRS